MSHLRRLTWSFGLIALLLPCTSRAADPAQPRGDSPARSLQPTFSLLERMQHLLVPGAQEKLDLTTEQLDQLAKLQYQFRAQRRDMLIKLADNLANKCWTKDDDGEDHFDTCQGALTIFTGLLRLRGAHDDFEAKAREVLTADQKKQYAHLESEWLRRLSERRAHRVHGAPVGGEWRVFEGPCQAQLKLTAEQRQQLRQLRQATDAKMKTILTDEQYQQLQPRPQHRLERIHEGDDQPSDRQPIRKAPREQDRDAEPSK